jgi:hypothetical protein
LAKSDLAWKRTTTFTLGVFAKWTTASVIDEIGPWEMSTQGVGGGGEIAYSGMIGGTVVNRPDGKENTITLEDGIPFLGEFTSFNNKGLWETADANPMVAIRSYNRQIQKALIGTMECENGFPECVFGLWSPIQNIPPQER